MKVLLGKDFRVYPIGCVGDDDDGRRLLEEMADVGLDLTHVGFLPSRRTLFSFCLLYPDGSGGNLTIDDSASSAVDPSHIEVARGTLSQLGKRGICAAVPEVPLEARIRLLDLAAEYGLFRAASFTSEEMPYVRESMVLEKIDFPTVNLDEMCSLLGLGRRELSSENIAKKAAEALSSRYEKLILSVTSAHTIHKTMSWSNISHLM